MDDPRTPTNLLDDRLWAGWGPPVDGGRITDQVADMVAESSGRSINLVANVMMHSEDRGRYLLVKMLSRTVHAVVYKGVDRLLARHVAIKIHRDTQRHAAEREVFESQASTRPRFFAGPKLARRSDSERVARRAIDESQTMSRLDHPNIVDVYDMGEHDRWMYSVMELCDCDLGQWSAGRSWREIIDRIIEAAFGLAHLHEVGFVHCDVKAKNILIKKGIAKLADFGHAMKLGDLVTDCGGTVGHIAPEVYRGEREPPSDVFALAVTTWHCLFGALPYPVPRGEHVTPQIAALATLQRATDREIERPEKVPPGLPDAVHRVLELALDPAPGVRPSLPRFIAELQVARDAEQVAEQRRSLLRRRVPAISAAVLVSVGLGFSIGTVSRSDGGEGAIVRTAVGAGGPIALAELAAMGGDGETAIVELNRLLSSAREMSKPELFSLASRTDRIADMLESTSPDHAALVRFLAQRFRLRQVNER